MNMNKSFKGMAVQRKSFLVVVEAPSKQLPGIMSYMQLYLFSRESEPWV
jgi:hypothetical protein